MAPMIQSARNVLMIRPRCFGPNAQTAASNAFQQSVREPFEVARASATAEFDAMVGALRAAGVTVLVIDDTDTPPKPDAVFPNNWVSFHANGDVIVYPLQAANRRPERRTEIVEQVAAQGGFRLVSIVDLSWLEERGHYLEGTGSLVLDHPANLAYAALSARTHPAALSEFARQTGFEVLSFETRDATGRPIYHTNVILSIGGRCAVVCAEAIASRQDRERVLGRIAGSGRTIIEISLAQAGCFAGNVLELDTTNGPRMVMSETALAAFTATQLRVLGESVRPLAVPLATIERVGGGSARCMLAEIFLPAAGAA
jgi:hypothetical protein